MSGRVRVLVVDDQELFREALVALLGSRPEVEVVGQAADGEQALAVAERVDPDVVLMDLRMPVLDGVSAIRRLRVERPRIRAVALTTFDGEDEVFAALRAGAVGYLLKDCSTRQLLDAVLAAHRGESVLAPSVTTKLVARVSTGDLPEPPSARQPLADPLTDRELEILRLIAKGLSNREISGQLFLSEGTVKNHVTNVLAKLGVRDRTQAVLRAGALGLL
ncbi:MAG TPA: response regulator transcription factor [Microlunatus sp.]|nr:response regulator transcription factor [Microlunatus sp.]